MIPAAFDYVRAGSADEAIALHRRARRRGQVPRRRPHPAAADEAAPRPADACSSTSAASATCRTSATRGDHIAIGALDPPPRRRDSATCSPSTCRCCAHAAGHVGDPQVRHRGTIGGSIAHGDPASDLPAALLALGATLRRAGPERRRARSPPTDFFTGLPRDGARARRDAHRDPRARRCGGAGWSFQKFNRRGPGLGDRRCRRVATNGRRGVGAGQHGLDADPRHARSSRRSPAVRRSPTPPSRPRPRAPSRRPTSTPASSTASTSPRCSCAAPSRKPAPEPSPSGVARQRLNDGRGARAACGRTRSGAHLVVHGMRVVDAPAGDVVEVGHDPVVEPARGSSPEVGAVRVRPDLRRSPRAGWPEARGHGFDCRPPSSLPSSGAARLA